MMQDLIQRRFGIAYHPHYVATLLHNLGFFYQKARLVSDHLNEASFAQWGSLSYTWAPKGQQPEVPTRGKRKGYKVFGLIDSVSGRFFYKAHVGRFNSESSATFWLDVLSQTTQHVVVIQDGARYHTSKAMQQFFVAHAGRLTIEPLPA
jgi:hypothetical protein